MDELENEFIGFFSKLMAPYGLGDLPTKVIGVLYLEPDEIALEEIAERTGYSLASISTTMKMLEAVGIAQRMKKPGSKKVFFCMEKDLARLNVMKLKAAKNNMIGPAKEALPEMIAKYKEKVKDKRSKERLKLIEGYYSQMLRFEKIIEHCIEKLEGVSAEHRKD